MAEQIVPADHRLNVIQQLGLFRHLQLVRADAPHSAQTVDIVTWPGFLAVASPMGSAIFRRAGDMLEVFRQPEIARADDEALVYIADRLLAVDRNGVRGWREGLFRLYITRRVQDHIGARQIGPEMASILRDAVHDQIMARINEGEHLALAAALMFSHQGLSFTQAELRANCCTWTTQFTWAVHCAIHCATLWADRPGDTIPDSLEAYRA